MSAIITKYERVIQAGKKEDIPTIEACKYLGDIYFSQGDFGKAITYFHKALEFDPTFSHLIASDIFYLLGESYQRIGETDLSIQYLQKAVEIFEEQGHIPLWQVYLTLAQVFQQTFTAQISHWLEYYHEVITILNSSARKPGQWFFWSKKVSLSEQMADAILEAHYEIGLFMLYKQEYEKAIYNFTEGIESGSKKQPTLAQAYFFLGRSYLHNNKYRKAQKIYQKLLDVDSDHQWVEAGPIYYDLGQLYYKQQQYKQALDYRLRILALEQLKPDMLADTHFGLGHTYFALGSYEQAADHYRKYLKMALTEDTKKVTALKYLVQANEALARKRAKE